VAAAGHDDRHPSGQSSQLAGPGVRNQHERNCRAPATRGSTRSRRSALRSRRPWSRSATGAAGRLQRGHQAHGQVEGDRQLQLGLAEQGKVTRVRGSLASPANVGFLARAT
jgi:conjugal transfer/entry exclusion protein